MYTSVPYHHYPSFFRPLTGSVNRFESKSGQNETVPVVRGTCTCIANITDMDPPLNKLSHPGF